MPDVVVHEHARLTTGSTQRAQSLDEASISESAFAWLCHESGRLRRSGAALVQVEDRQWLRLDNYVGVLETPCGTRIEVLPKILESSDEAPLARCLLRRMLARCMEISPRETGVASIQTFEGPLTEWVMRQFLSAFETIVKRGVRFDYHNVEDEQRFLRGRLAVSRQLRQPPGREHRFQIEHDVFDADRAENRLLRTALERVRTRTQDTGNWRLAQELTERCSEIPASTNVSRDFRLWREDRLMAHYADVRPWCALILNKQAPFSLLGEWEGKSLLFPMERLFEHYVWACLRRALPSDVHIRHSASTRYLCTHQGRDWFQLRPDFLLQRGEKCSVLDAKWKLLDASLSDPERKYGLNQSDFYQLAAYGQKYMNRRGTMMLVYPKTRTFFAPLPEFRYTESLSLRVVPFDLESGTLVTGEALASII